MTIAHRKFQCRNCNLIIVFWNCHYRTEPSAEESQTEKATSDPPVDASADIPAAAAAATGGGDKTVDPEAVWSTPELVDAILEENFKLRQQVQNHQDHIAKLQKFEKELSAVQSAHQALVRSSERKESLERSARLRLEAEWRRSQEMNGALRNQVELLSSQLTLRSGSVASLSADPASAADWQNQIARRDALIAQLVSQSTCREIKFHISTFLCSFKSFCRQGIDDQ